MEWSNKTELCSLLNRGEYEKALNIVLENIDEMDEQAWDMFFNGMLLTKECIQPNIEQHRVIVQKTKDMQSGSMRTALRMAFYETLVGECLEV